MSAKHKPSCVTCARPMHEHTLEQVNGRLEWVCPTVVVAAVSS